MNQLSNLGGPGDVSIKFRNGIKKVEVTGITQSVQIEGVRKFQDLTTTFLNLDIDDLKITEEWIFDKEALRKIATEFITEQEQRKRGDRSPLELPLSISHRVEKLYEGADSELIKKASDYAYKLTQGAKTKVEYKVTLNEPPTVDELLDEDDDLGFGLEDDDYEDHDYCCEDRY